MTITSLLTADKLGLKKVLVPEMYSGETLARGVNSHHQTDGNHYRKDAQVEAVLPPDGKELCQHF